jgi:deazaflavin-dependent oxidoreductase (nitroreductase family)
MLLLTTSGRNSGAKRTTPLIYQRHGDDYLVVASNGGGDPPGWLLNLQDDPIVAVQVKADHHTARARVATAEQKPELWRIMTATVAPYDESRPRPTARSRWWSSSRARPSGCLIRPRQTRWARDEPHGSAAPGPCRERILIRHAGRRIRKATPSEPRDVRARGQAVIIAFGVRPCT